MSFLITHAYINMMIILNLYTKILNNERYIIIYQIMKFQLLTESNENILDINDWFHHHNILCIYMFGKGNSTFTLSNESDTKERTLEETRSHTEYRNTRLQTT